jgi:hypothetical protein
MNRYRFLNAGLLATLMLLVSGCGEEESGDVDIFADDGFSEASALAPDWVQVRPVVGNGAVEVRVMPLFPPASVVTYKVTAAASGQPPVSCFTNPNCVAAPANESACTIRRGDRCVVEGLRNNVSYNVTVTEIDRGADNLLSDGRVSAAISVTPLPPPENTVTVFRGRQARENVVEMTEYDVTTGRESRRGRMNAISLGSIATSYVAKSETAAYVLWTSTALGQQWLSVVDLSPLSESQPWRSVDLPQMKSARIGPVGATVGWKALSLSYVSDSEAYVLLSKTSSGQAALWKIDPRAIDSTDGVIPIISSSFLYSVQGIGAGWEATSYAHVNNSKGYVLWSKVSTGDTALWTINPSAATGSPAVLMPTDTVWLDEVEPRQKATGLTYVSSNELYVSLQKHTGVSPTSSGEIFRIAPSEAWGVPAGLPLHRLFTTLQTGQTLLEARSLSFRLTPTRFVGVESGAAPDYRAQRWSLGTEYKELAVANDLYGSAGYYFLAPGGNTVAQPVVNGDITGAGSLFAKPAFLTANPTPMAGTWVNFPGYNVVNRPGASSPSDAVRIGGISAAFNGSTSHDGVDTQYADAFTFRLDVNKKFRIGVMVDAFAAGGLYAPDYISVYQNDDNRTTYSHLLTRDGTADHVLFDIDGTAGTVYTIALHQKAPVAASVTGFSMITFDEL